MAEILTTWQPTGNQVGEYSASSALALVDPSAVALVDPTGVAIFDTGITFTPISNTIWTGDAGA